MAKFNLVYLLLCYNRFNTYALEITSIIISIIGCILTYIGVYYIPFWVDSSIFKYIFIINIPYFILIIILNIICLSFRKLDLINNVFNTFNFGVTICAIYIALFGFVTNLINDSITLCNMKYYQETLSLKKNLNNKKKLTNNDWAITIIIIFLIFFFWINLLFISLSDNILINLKINRSYHTYELAIEEEKRFNTKREEGSIPEESEDNNKNDDEGEKNVNNEEKNNKGENIKDSIIIAKKDDLYASHNIMLDNKNNIEEKLKENEEQKK